MVHNPSQTNSSRRRVSSYLHRLSSLAGSNDSTAPAAPPPDPDILLPPPRTPPSPTTEAPPSIPGPPDPSDELLPLPPNSPSAPLTPAHPTQAAPADGATSTSAVNPPVAGMSKIMARHRSTSQSLRRSISESATGTITPTVANGPSHELPSIRLVPHEDPRANRPSLTFPPMARTLPSDDSIIRVGRYSERDAAPNPPPNVPSAAPVGFKSKVVSRKHCEFWCQNGQWYIKDVKSSSGTFLNHIRLSQPSLESRPFPVKDGDVVQLGIDFRGGEEMIFRCVKIRVECNRGWQKALNSFNVATHKRLLGKPHLKKDADADATSAQSSECAICLMSIAPCQALFVAPCSHVWHYKCIRPILNDHKTFPSFLCPNCRAVADLDADVDDPDAMNDWEDDEDSSGSVAGPKETPAVDGPSHEAAQRALDEEDTSLATATTRQLSVRNGMDPPPESAEYTGVDAPPPSRSALSPTADRGTASSSLPNLLNRRNAQGITPPRHMPLPSTVEGQALTTPLSQHVFLRPITPSQSLLADGDFLSREATTSDAMTPGSEIGPMTPTNNAGPFVFDGSAGRDSIHRPTASSPGIPDEVRSEA
ncbi:MAG: hypothetical protein L6R36_000280 [Xanthoria steineri]|nr:MAG: hypothetical protein L6R36_000280 [Xanthoria steineri]